MFNIIRRQFLHHRAFLIGSAVILCGFHILLCAVVASMDIPAVFNQMLLFIPPLLRAMVEQSMGGGTNAGMLAFGWNHPITHALLIAPAITFGAGAIAGEIENGAIELILAQPLSRLRYVLGHLIFAMVAMTMVSFVGSIGTIAGQRIFKLEVFGWDRMLGLLFNVFLLQMSLYLLTLMFSSFGRESGRVATLGVLVAIVSFLINTLATLWSKAAFIKPYSLHSYYDPRAVLVAGHFPASSVIVLGLFALAATTGAFARFLTRDLP